MRLLREFVATATYPIDRSATFAGLLWSLRQMAIDVEESNELRGTVVARCLTLAANAIVWRCWSDRLLFELKSVDSRTTKLDIYAIPNLFRIRAPEKEDVTQLDRIVPELIEKIRQCGTRGWESTSGGQST
jgi:hypothetical protein